MRRRHPSAFRHRFPNRLRFTDLVLDATLSVKRNLARSLLTSLGTVFGVATVVAVVGITTTNNAQVSERFDALRTTDILIHDGAPDHSGPAFPNNAEERLALLGSVEEAGLTWTVPNVRIAARRQSPDRILDVPVIAATPSALDAMGVEVVSGRVFDDFHEDNGLEVALVSADVADDLGLQGTVPSSAVFLDTIGLTVLGIYQDTDRNTEVLQGIIIPTSTALRLGLDNAPRVIIVEVVPGAARSFTRQAPYLLRPDDPSRIAVIAAPDPIQFREAIEGELRTLLLAVAGVSLLAGAVGISAATMGTIIERRHEIGLRRAMGARPAHIMTQMIAETAAIGSVGGIIGASVGVLIVVAIAAVNHWTPTINPLVPFLAPFGGTIVGVIAGLIPARAATRILPTQALTT